MVTCWRSAASTRRRQGGKHGRRRRAPPQADAVAAARRRGGKSEAQVSCSCGIGVCGLRKPGASASIGHSGSRGCLAPDADASVDTPHATEQDADSTALSEGGCAFSEPYKRGGGRRAAPMAGLASATATAAASSCAGRTALKVENTGPAGGRGSQNLAPSATSGDSASASQLFSNASIHS